MTARLAFLYARVSTTAQGDTSDPAASIPRQRDELRKLAATNGDTILEVFEEAQTAHEAGRPRYEAMMARLNEVQAVYVVAYDRLTRIPDPSEQEAVRRAFASHRVDIVSPGHVWRYSDPAFDTPMTRLHQRVTGTFTAYEWETIVGRLQKGKVRKAELGHYYGHPVPYGYAVTFDATTGAKVFSVDEAQAAIVRTVFQLYREGHAVAAIARELNTLGVPSPRGAKWSTQGAWHMLRQQTYAGRSRLAAKFAKRKPSQARLVATPIDVPSLAFVPIVDAATWEAVQAQIGQKSRPRRQASAYPLSGILACPTCGGRLGSHGTWQRTDDGAGKRQQAAYYACVAKDRARGGGSIDPPEACPGVFYNQATAHAALHKWLLRELPKYVIGRRQVVEAPEPDAEMVVIARRRALDLDKQWTNAANLAELGVYTPDEAAVRFAALRDDMRQTKSHLEALERTQATAPKAQEISEGLLTMLRETDPDAPELRAMYTTLLAEVRLVRTGKVGRTVTLRVGRVRFINGDWWPSAPRGRG